MYANSRFPDVDDELAKLREEVASLRAVKPVNAETAPRLIAESRAGADRT